MAIAIAGRCVHSGDDDDKQLAEQTGVENNQDADTEDGAESGTEGSEGSGDAENEADKPVFDPENPYAIFEGALFIGDSRTEGMKIYSGITNADFFCAKSMTIDKVVSGNQVSINGQSMSITDVLKSKTYTKVYICLGINELGWVSVDKFTGEYQQLLDKIKELQPNAEIFIELLFPVSSDKSAEDKVINNSRIYWYNVNLMELADENGIKYLNPDAPLIDEKGALKDEASSDGVHINSEYCKKWAEYLAQITYQ